ncbi:MAG: LicD family protein, partial [Candidatus Margulisbacteria bacterium]|nr:LicD family protein [Candidatus Margulisiibacteriota bacterium]
TNTLNKAKIKYWLDGGTLLGLYRDGSLISYDSDVDLGIYSLEPDVPDNYRKFQNILIPAGLYLKTDKGVRKEVRKYETQDKSLHIDLWIFRKRIGFYYHRAWKGYFIFPKECLDILTTLKIGDNEFSIPNNPELYLTWLYGCEWKKT